jgi:hypothetical protein
MIVTDVQAHTNFLGLADFPVRVAKGADRAMSEYDEEVVGEEQDWSDFDNTSEYDDFDLPWT